MKSQGKPLPDTCYLRERLRLEANGVLYWKRREGDTREVNSWNAKHAGKPAGSLDHKGYVVIRLNGMCYKAHRIVYAMVNEGCPPELDIDHIDNDSTNNDPKNLRAVTTDFNSARKRNKRGSRGIHAREHYRSSI